MSEREDSHKPPRARRPNVTILLTFLGVFLLLLIVFREVLFPFLMAMFIAYLVEPVVQRVTRSRVFGIKWTRGPTIVLIYVVIVGGAVFGALKGLTALASYVRTTAQGVADAANEEVGRLLIEIDPAHAEALPVPIPKGTQLTGPGNTRFETVHDVTLESASHGVGALLEVLTGKLKDAPPGATLAFSDGSHALLRLSMGPRSTGLELKFEQELITPIVENVKSLGMKLEPTTVREFLSHKTGVWKEALPEKLGVGAVRFAGKIALSVYQFFLILMLTAFIVTDRKGISQFFVNLTPEPYRPAYLKLMSYVDDGLAGVIRGQIVICGVNGALTWIGLTLLGVKGALMLSGLAAVLSLIPIFGTIVSSIPIVLIASTEGIDTGIFALIWIGFIHMLEGNVLNPMIMGSHAKMHPVVIVFALLAGEHAFGIWGALLAVPTMSMIQACFRFYLHEIEGLPKAQDDGHGDTFKRLWGWIRSKFSGGSAKTGEQA